MKDPSEIPDGAALKDAATFEIFTENGGKVTFGSLFSKQKTIVVFIRHFFCGICHRYVEALASIPEDALDTANTRIVVIGCGDHSPIKAYKETTGFKGELYADPTRKLYRMLGMDIENLKTTPAGEEKKTYVPQGHLSLLANIFTSIWRGPVKHPSHIGKQGNMGQLGGDFILGPGNVCTYASRMRNTHDRQSILTLIDYLLDRRDFHGADSEIVDLMKEAGVVYSQEPGH